MAMPIPYHPLGNILTADPPPAESLSNLRALLWIGMSLLLLAFGLLVLVTIFRIVRRQYFRDTQKDTAPPQSPWEAAGQRVAPVQGGQAIDKPTPDDDPEGYRARQAEHDPNDDTGPFDTHDDPDSDPDDDHDDDFWKRGD